MGKLAPIAAAIAGPSILGSAGGFLGSLGSILGPISTITSAISGAQGLLAKKPKAPAAPVAAQAPEFKPEKPAPIARPSELGAYAGFAPEQERSAIATKGLNTGIGKQEEDYYRNLLQRTLIGDNNQVVGNANTLLPVESQYFSRQGLNTSDIMKFLEQLKG